jgi:hypothetical protein
MKQLIKVVAIFMILLILGCGGTKEVQIGEEKIIDTSSPNKPDWITKSSDWEDQFLYVTGTWTNAKIMSVAITQAEIDGTLRLQNTMKNRIETDVAQAVSGANLEEGDIGVFTKYAIAWVSETKNNQGITIPERYWEKVQKVESGGVKYFYNAWTRLKISKKDYDASLYGAFEEMKRQAQKANNKEAKEAANKCSEKVYEKAKE